TVTQGASSARVRFYWAVSSRVAIAFIADQTSVVGESVSLAVLATIPGGGALTDSATGLPSGVSINSSTGVISGTPATATQRTPASVTVTASQGSCSASRTFKWHVETPVVSGGLTARSVSYSESKGHRLSVGGASWDWPTVLDSASATSGGPRAVTAVNGASSAVGAMVTLPSGASCRWARAGSSTTTRRRASLGSTRSA
ncbi:MAG: putative Ig domain-containing protein, partial [Gemmataceae bacterium]|nr:putative Ig domain-containing protein [Gemmataceae bacterium]